ncbi:PhzF family phenazine biosynthesis protein [Streptomyces albus subsp. chlorinus]|uniref:PhzF family phenazine biosynthesis protein n=1 Tax=Streptomyces albus TaxID=1888 RepID=UPI001570CD1C|nr:PhzF family phenazine biosynthesis isomerase [Streptomyces albus]NSC21426.1 PhzF family phenazine biosynthesis protein [Streptomyces albus subsp. chlorinus]
MTANETVSLPSDVLRYTAFSGEPGGGNPAGVVLDASGLDDEERLAVAAEVGYSETAFVTAAPGEGERTFVVRYFSPLAEVAFCGHATIATAVALGERIGPGELLFETPAGPIPVLVSEDGRGRPLATLSSVEPHSKPVDDADLAEALAALDWAKDDLDPRIPPRIAFAGNDHLVLAVTTRERLAALDYDFERLKALMLRLGLTTLHLVWREAPDVFHVRDPFPVGGVREDPATGAAAAAFGGYARELGIVPEEARLLLHQGEDMGRPGLLTVELRAGDPRVHVSGTATRIG